MKDNNRTLYLRFKRKILAKFRTNHSRRKNSGLTSLRLIAFVILVAALMGYLYLTKNVDKDLGWNIRQSEDRLKVSSEKLDDLPKTFLPVSSTGQIVEHKYYTLSYSEKHEQPEWVAYKLTEESLRLPNVKRAKNFKPDYDVQTRSAYHSDYSNSGYTRGHMAPAGDMAFSKEAMQESFFMSNMSPQVKECNGGIWRELEENVRDWAFDNDELYIVSGPVLSEGHIITTIGKKNRVSVPDSFFKIILDNEGRERKAIAFIIPNKRSERHLKEYAVSIDQIEELTGLDMFAGFLSEEDEEKLEAQFDVSDWNFDSKRFKDRIRNWNNR